MAINSGPSQNRWQTIISIFSSAVRIPMALLTIFIVVCASVIGFVFIYRLTMWLFITLLARPWN